MFTVQVLSLLRRYKAPAVFCVIGDNASAYPELVQRETASGHRLCDHSRDHDLRMRRKGAGYDRAEVLEGLREVRRASGDADVRFYRQPGGLWDRTVVGALYGAGLNPLRWTDDPRDWSRPGVVAVAQRVLLRLRPGAVVLLHDGGGDRTDTVAALGWLLPHLTAAGWHFVLPVPTRLSVQRAARPQ